MNNNVYILIDSELNITTKVDRISIYKARLIMGWRDRRLTHEECVPLL